MLLVRVVSWTIDDVVGEKLLLWCPGCDDIHAVSVGDPPVTWGFDGNFETPTITPSILVHGIQWHESEDFHNPNHRVPRGAQTTCHSFVRDGKWIFLGDSTHHLAGQTVDMVELPDWISN